MSKPNPLPTDGVRYYGETVHQRNRLTGQPLDWANQPTPYKHYSGIQQRPLPPPTKPPATTLADLLNPEQQPATSAAMDVAMLAGMLNLAYGPTAQSKHGGQRFLFRSAPSAGALYPAEIYLLSENITGLEPGLYHYPVQRHALTPLRQGSFLAATAGMIADKAMGSGGTLALFFITGIFFRSAWKYGPRAYRYVLLDAGHLMENLVLVIRAMGLTPRVHYDFGDQAVGRFLGLDAEKEAALAVVQVLPGALGDPSAMLSQGQSVPLADLPQSFIQAGRVSPQEQTFPQIAAIHRASCHGPKPGGKKPDLGTVTESPPQWHPQAADRRGDPTALPLAEALMRRRSRRNFIRAEAATFTLGPTIELLRRWYTNRANQAVGSKVAVKCGVIVPPDNEERLAAGFHLIDPGQNRLGLVFQGDMLTAMASACLDQMWLRGAGAHFVFLANLAAVQKVFGPRGFRYLMMDAGRLGELVYLNNSRSGWGACGIGAYYDREAQTILDLNPDSALIYLVAAGATKGR